MTDTGRSTVIQAPGNVVDLSWAIEAIGLSPAGTLCVIGGRSGKLVVLDKVSGLIRVRLHVQSFPRALRLTDVDRTQWTRWRYYNLSVLPLWPSHTLGCN